MRIKPRNPYDSIISAYREVERKAVAAASNNRNWLAKSLQAEAAALIAHAVVATLRDFPPLGMKYTHKVTELARVAHEPSTWMKVAALAKKAAQVWEELGKE